MDKKSLVEKVIEKVADKKSFLNELTIAEVNKLAIRLKKVEAAEVPQMLEDFFKASNLSLDQKNEVMTSLIAHYRIPLVSAEHKEVLKKFIKDNRLTINARF